MEQQFTLKLHQALTPSLQTSLKVLAMPLPQLVPWLEEQIKENPLLSLDPVSSSKESHTAYDSDEEEDIPLQEIEGRFYEENYPEENETYRPRVTQTMPLVEQRDLFEHLAEQAREKFTDPAILSQALELIAQIDEKGYLPSVTEENELLLAIQSFDPPGIAARSHQESLLIQLKRKNASKIAIALLEHHYDELLRQHFKKISKKLGIKENDLLDIIHSELSTLSIAPGLSFKKSTTIPWIPDLHIHEEDGSFSIEIEESLLPKISLDHRYNFSACETTTRSYLHIKRKEALFIQQALQKRAVTLRRLGNLLLKTQLSFFEGKDPYPSPITIEKGAEALHLHPSTISRAILDKVISTPRGIFLLEDFFRNPQAIPLAVERTIAEWIQKEDKNTPLSDAMIANRLQTLGLVCSRRTVAKYRKALQLQTARLRKL